MKRYTHRYELCIYTDISTYVVRDCSNSRKESCKKCNEIADPACITDTTRINSYGQPTVIYKNAAADEMFASKKRPRKSTAAQLRANYKYDRANTTQVHLKFNNGTDADILGVLAAVDSKQTYIKQLIREDIAKNIK